MSVLRKEIRAWWIEKPLGHNMPTDVVFEDFKPTVTNAPGREWIRVISLDDFHSSTNINITRYVELCKRASQIEKAKRDNERSLSRHNGFLFRHPSRATYAKRVA